MRARLLAVLAAAALLAGCSVTPEDPQSEPTVPPLEKTGRMPDVSLPDITGGPAIDLRSLRGPLVVTLFASWCTPCKKELPIIADFARANEAVTVLGVDYQDQDKQGALRLMRRSDVDFPVVFDFDGVVSRAIGLPRMFMLDASGEVVFDEYVPITSSEQLAGLVEENLGVEVS